MKLATERSTGLKYAIKTVPKHSIADQDRASQVRDSEAPTCGAELMGADKLLAAKVKRMNLLMHQQHPHVVSALLSGRKGEAADSGEECRLNYTRSSLYLIELGETY